MLLQHLSYMHLDQHSVKVLHSMWKGINMVQPACSKYPCTKQSTLCATRWPVTPF